MASSIPTPLHIQDSRYAKQDGCRPDDICLCSPGNIAVSGHRPYPYQSYVCIYGSTVDNSDSRDKPTLLYHKQFTDKVSWLPRCISFIKPNSTEIVTCLYDEVQVIDYNRDVVLRSRKVNGETMCLSVSESQIFIGLVGSDIVNIYDNDLNEIKSIRLKGIRGDCPWDIAAAADRLYVCTADDYRAIVYSQDSGSILTEYKGQYRSMAWSMAVNMQHQIVAVLWNREQVAVYSINSNNCLVVFNVESGVSRIRISDQGRIVTGNEDTGEVKVFSLTQFFTYDNLKVTLSSLLSDSDQEELLKYFKISDDILKDDRDHSNDSDDSGDSDDSEDSDGMGDGKKKKARLLTILEKKGLLQDRNFQDLKQAFSHLGIWNTSIVMSHIDFYQQHTAMAFASNNSAQRYSSLNRGASRWNSQQVTTSYSLIWKIRRWGNATFTLFSDTLKLMNGALHLSRHFNQLYSIITQTRDELVPARYLLRLTRETARSLRIVHSIFIDFLDIVEEAWRLYDRYRGIFSPLGNTDED